MQHSPPVVCEGCGRLYDEAVLKPTVIVESSDPAVSITFAPINLGSRYEYATLCVQDTDMEDPEGVTFYGTVEDFVKLYSALRVFINRAGGVYHA